jgi:hypothetical protein
MTCSAVLKSEGKPYPRTCEEHGLSPCPEPQIANEGLEWIKRFAEAKGEVDSQWIVNEILQHEDGNDNAVRRVLVEAAKLLAIR